MDGPVGLSSRGEYYDTDYPVRNFMPKKPYFRTVAEMESGMEEYLRDCESRDIPPTVIGFADRYGRLDVYSRRKGRKWAEIAERVRARIDSAFIEYAFTHPAFQRLSSMKLAHVEEFRPIRQEVAVEEKHVFDFRRIREIADMLDAEDVEEISDTKMIEEAGS